MLNFLLIFSWVLNLIVVWGISKYYPFSQFQILEENIILVAAFLLMILWPIYWVFTVSAEKREETPPAAEEPVEIKPTSLCSIPKYPLSEAAKKQSEKEMKNIFIKVEKVAVNAATKEEIESLKKQIQIKILRSAAEQIFTIEKLQEEMLMIVEMSNELNDAEKMVLCHNIRQYIDKKMLDNHFIT